MKVQKEKVFCKLCAVLYGLQLCESFCTFVSRCQVRFAVLYEFSVTLCLSVVSCKCIICCSLS